MKNRILYLFVILSILFLTAVPTANAQYIAGNSYLGPSIGFAFLGNTPDFGVNYEYGLNMHNVGLVGIGGIFRYWGYSASDWKYTDVLIGAQGNYHFANEGSNTDLYVGLVLAYDAGSVSWNGPNGESFSSPSYGGFWIAVQGGLRYWVSPTIALTGRVGFGTLGYSGLDFGVDFKL